MKELNEYVRDTKDFFGEKYNVSRLGIIVASVMVILALPLGYELGKSKIKFKESKIRERIISEISKEYIQGLERIFERLSEELKKEKLENKKENIWTI